LAKQGGNRGGTAGDISGKIIAGFGDKFATGAETLGTYAARITRIRTYIAIIAYNMYCHSYISDRNMAIANLDVKDESGTIHLRSDRPAFLSS
jgi:hypothetical protein